MIPRTWKPFKFADSIICAINEFEKAVEDFKTWLASDEKNIEAYHEVARSLAALEKYKEAIEIMDDAVKLDEESTKSLLLRAQLNLLGKTYDAAVEDATKALKLDRKLFTARLIRAQALFDKGEYDDALEDVDQVLQEEPNVLAGINLRFEINLQKGDFGEAIKDLKVLADLAPTNIGFQLQLAQLYTADDQPRRAIRIYNRVLSAIETDSEEANEVRKLILRGRGDARLSLGQHKEAIEDYTKAMEIDPNDDGVLNNLAWVLATSPVDELRDGKKAIELATKACEATEYKRPHILSTLASGFAEAGDFEKAREWIEKAIEVNEADSAADKDGDQAAYEEQLKSLKNELPSYEKEEPWRELQNVEEDKAKKSKEDDAESDDGEADKESAPDKKQQRRR